MSSNEPHAAHARCPASFTTTNTTTKDTTMTETSQTIEPEPLQFATLRSTSYGSRPPREVALDLAINSLPQNSGNDAIVARATAYLAFLDPDDTRRP